MRVERQLFRQAGDDARIRVHPLDAGELALLAKLGICFSVLFWFFVFL